MITYCFLEYPIRLYTHLFHVDTLSTKKKVCLQRPHLLCPPSTGRGRLGAFRVQEIAASHQASSHHENIRRLLSNAIHLKIRPDFLREVVTLFFWFQRVPLKKTWQNLAASQISFIAPFVQHRYPQGVASLDDHVDSSTVASKYLGEIRWIRRRHLPRCSTVEF